MIRIDDLALFVSAAAQGSFSNAARKVNLQPGQVSAAILRLERELDIRLFARSTRSLRLTDEGERYLPYATGMLELMRNGYEELHQDDGALSGTVQLSAPSDFGRNLLLPWLAEFRQAHPKVELQVLLSDQLSDVFRDRVDVALRYGSIDDASFVALPLAPDNRRVLVASPAYVAQRGRPATLAALREHSCLLFQLQGRVYDKWQFGDAPDAIAQTVSGNWVSDDADAVRRLAIAGEGIAYKSWLDVCADVQAGRLVRLLPEARGELAPLHMICPHRKQFSPALRQLHGLLAARCRALDVLRDAL